MFLLIPGRHHCVTNFHKQELFRVMHQPINQLTDLFGNKIDTEGTIDSVVWAVTSSNHSNTRRNPLSYAQRSAMIEAVNNGLGIGHHSYCFPIVDIRESDKYLQYILKTIEVESRGVCKLDPSNTIVGVSTPHLAQQWSKLGFKVLPFELENLGSLTYKATRPWEVIERVAILGESRKYDDMVLQHLSSESYTYLDKYNLAQLIQSVFADPLLSGDGDLTETREYNTYARAFDDGARRKYDLTKQFIKPGKLVDIGCCTGSYMRELTKDQDLRESDFYGIEIARHLFTECIKRKESGTYFFNPNVYFYQRNVVGSKIFEDNSVDLFTSFSLTHEIESYSGRDSLHQFIKNIKEQLKIGGRWINNDVIGPENPDKLIHLRCTKTDGADLPTGQLISESDSDTKSRLDALHTSALFQQFAHDFRNHEGYNVAYKIISEDEIKTVYECRLGDAAEFLSKKDYTDNRFSEMHETFCYRSYQDWCHAVTKEGLSVVDGSHQYTNPRIVENRYIGKVELLDTNGNILPYPVTNMLLVVDRIEQ